jgi:hypothetical protein
MMAQRKAYTLQDKQSAIRDALRRMEPVHLHWRMLEALYRTGAQRELTQLDLNRILPFPVPGSFLRTVNMLLPHLNLLINSVTARDPKFTITPTDGDPYVVERNGSVAKAVLDYFWRRADATSVLRDMTQDMVVVGNGFCKVGWAYSESTVDRTSEEINLETEELISAANEASLEFGLEMDEQMLQEIVEAVSLTDQLVEVDEPYVEYVSPYDIFLPSDARRINNARWICQRLRLPVDEIQSNPLFSKKALDELKTDTGYADHTTLEHYEMRDEGLPAAFAYATLYEFYDMRDRTLCVFQLDAENPLYMGEIPYAHRYPPFVHMRNYSDGGSTFWGFGDVENVAGIQLMVNEIMVAEINDLKRVGNNYFINKKVLTPEMAKALADNRPDKVIPVDLPANIGINEVMMPVQRLATPADNYIMEEKLQSYMQRILGISDLQAGSMSSASRVPATAAAAVEGATTTRVMEKLVNVEKASREIGTRMLALCQQFMDESKAIRIAGPNAVTWLEVSSEDIDGEFSVEAESGSTQAINPATRARQGVDILSIVVPALVQLGYNPEPAMRTALQYMGLNPDHLLLQQSQPEIEMGSAPEDASSQILPQEPALQPDMGADIMQQLGAMGAPPVPAAGTGEMAL